MAGGSGGDGVGPSSYAFLVFQGGGAAGIVHVGALRAIQQLGIQPLGVAGASAGAIIAALLAAGYGPDAMVTRGENSNWNIFRRNQQSPVFLLGNHDWAILGAFMVAPVGILLLVSLLVSGLATFLALLLVTSLSWLASRIIFARWSLPAPVRLLFRLGWFPGERGRDFLETLLAGALDAANPQWRTRDSNRPAPFVRFIDLIDDRFLPLRVITTDIESGRMRIFDSTRTPFHSVADAVIASMSIPLVFPPARVREDRAGAPPGPRYVDGGLLSNLPVPALVSQRRSSERQLGERIPIIAFAIDAPGRQRPAPRLWIWRYLARVLRTGIFGSQAEGIALVPGVIVVRLETDIGLTRFDLDRDTALAAIANAERQTIRLLNWRLFQRPREAANALARLAGRLRKALGGAGSGARLRATLYRLTDDEDLVVTESWNRTADPDAILSLDPASPVAREVLSTRKPGHVVVARLGPLDMVMRPDEHRLLPHWLHSQLGFPIFGSAGSTGPPAGLLLVESDRDLGFVLNDPPLVRDLLARAQAAARFLADAAP